MYFYNQQLLDDFDNKGDTIRRKNRLKAENLMGLCTGFSDQETLAKIHSILAELTPEQKAEFIDYVNNKKFLKRMNHNSEPHKIIQKMVRVAITSTPKDDEVRKIKEQYNANLVRIDEIKVKMGKSKDPKELTLLMHEADALNAANVKLFEAIGGLNNKS